MIDINTAFRELDGLMRQRTSFGRITTLYDEADCFRLFLKTGQSLVPGFVMDEENRFAYENLLRWVDGRPFQCLDPFTGDVIPGDVEKGVYLCGPTGSGKTTLLEVLRYYSRAVMNNCYLNDNKTLMLWKTRRAETICNAFATTGDIMAYYNERFLCIDDIGTEPKESNYMGNRLEVIKSILETRGDTQNQITLLTSNFRIKEGIYGERVTSRLCKMCNYFELIHKDWRKNNV